MKGRLGVIVDHGQPQFLPIFTIPDALLVLATWCYV